MKTLLLIALILLNLFFFIKKESIVTSKNDTEESKDIFSESTPTSLATFYINSYSVQISIKSIKLNLSLWGSSEVFHSTDSILTIQIFNGTEFLDYYSFDVDNLSTNNNGQPCYKILFTNNINCFRIYASSSPIGNKNKGRIVIGNILIYY